MRQKREESKTSTFNLKIKNWKKPELEKFSLRSPKYIFHQANVVWVRKLLCSLPPETYLSLKLSPPKTTLSNPLNSIRSQGILNKEDADSQTIQNRPYPLSLSNPPACLALHPMRHVLSNGRKIHLISMISPPPQASKFDHGQFIREKRCIKRSFKILIHDKPFAWQRPSYFPKHHEDFNWF